MTIAIARIIKSRQ